MESFRPLLSATLEDPLRLTYPVLCSPKYDGLRCLILDGKAVSRNLKPFRNTYVQQCLRYLPHGLDGELIVGEPNRGNVLGRTQSGIMSTDGTPDFTYYIFDDFSKAMPFVERHKWLLNIVDDRVVRVPHVMITSHDHFIEYEQKTIDEGYEGVMVRSINGRYKYGRATHNDQILWKFKRFKDSEALVYGLEEGVSNQNEPTVDNLGHSKRSHHQENYVPAQRVGTILARDLTTGHELRVSPGEMTAEDRKYYWENQQELIGQTITIKYFEYGMLNQPRFCTFKSLYKEH